MESTKDANSLWENLCESKSHPFSPLTASTEASDQYGKKDMGIPLLGFHPAMREGLVTDSLSGCLEDLLGMLSYLDRHGVVQSPEMQCL